MAGLGQVASGLRGPGPGQLRFRQHLIAVLAAQGGDRGVERCRGFPGESGREQRAGPVDLQAWQDAGRDRLVRPRRRVEPLQGGRDIAAEQVAVAEVLCRLGGEQRLPALGRDEGTALEVVPGQLDIEGVQVQDAAVEQHRCQQLRVGSGQRFGRGEFCERGCPPAHAEQDHAALRVQVTTIGLGDIAFRAVEQPQAVFRSALLGFQQGKRDDQAGRERTVQGWRAAVFAPAQFGQPGPYLPRADRGLPGIPGPLPSALGLTGTTLGGVHQAVNNTSAGVNTVFILPFAELSSAARACCAGGRTTKRTVPRGTLGKANLPSVSASTARALSWSETSTRQAQAGASQPSTRAVPSALASILIMMVSSVLSNVMVRLSSDVPRVSAGSKAASSTSRAASASRSASATANLTRSVRSGGAGSTASNSALIFARTLSSLGSP